MNLPNILTLSRLVLAVLLIILLDVALPFAKTAALLIFALAGITDYFDGHLARTKYGTSAFGQLMDPLTDKVIVCAAFISFVELRLVPAWIAVVIVSREFLVTGLRLLAAARGDVLSAGRWGKHKMVWQTIAIVVILLGLAIQNDLLKTASSGIKETYDSVFGLAAFGIGLLAALITALTGIMYFLEHRELLKHHMGWTDN